MALETDVGRIGELSEVVDSQGELDRPTNESLQRAIKEQTGNFTGFNAEKVQTGGTAGEALPAHAVSDGATVLVTYLEGNTGNVYIGDDGGQYHPLTKVGDGFTARVADTSSIYIRTPTTGDGVAVFWQ